MQKIKQEIQSGNHRSVRAIMAGSLFVTAALLVNADLSIVPEAYQYFIKLLPVGVGTLFLLSLLKR